MKTSPGWWQPLNLHLPRVQATPSMDWHSMPARAVTAGTQISRLPCPQPSSLSTLEKFRVYCTLPNSSINVRTVPLCLGACVENVSACVPSQVIRWAPAWFRRRIAGSRKSSCINWAQESNWRNWGERDKLRWIRSIVCVGWHYVSVPWKETVERPWAVWRWLACTTDSGRYISGSNFAMGW